MVYYTNDQRADIKKEINLKYDSFFVEEKSYKNYSDRKLSQEERIKWFFVNYYETGMELETLLISMKDEDLDNFVWRGENITIPNSSLEASRTDK